MTIVAEKLPILVLVGALAALASRARAQESEPQPRAVREPSRAEIAIALAHYRHEPPVDFVVASALRAAADDFIARYGPEEFAVVLPNTNAENARLLAERIRRSVEESRIQAATDTVSAWVTVSVGVVTTTAEFNQSSSVLVKSADQAMHKSKQAGRNRVTEVNLAKVD